MATHSSVLAWRIPGTGEPGGCPQSLPASESFSVSQPFAGGGQSTGVSALSFDEFVGEKVFSPSYSSTILAPPPVGCHF